LKKDGLVLKNVVETAAITAPAGVNGVPVYLTIILVFIALALGFAAGYFLLGNGKLLFERKKIDEEKEEDDSSNIVM